MPAHFPHHYDVSLAWTGERGAVLSAGPRPPLAGGAPPQFDGSDAHWSPEHLLLSALGLCLLTTFQSLTRRHPLALRAYESRVEGVLDKTSEGLVFTSIVEHVRVQVAPDEVERAQGLLQTAKKHCLVANALRVPVELDAEVTAAAG